MITLQLLKAQMKSHTKIGTTQENIILTKIYNETRRARSDCQISADT